MAYIVGQADPVHLTSGVKGGLSSGEGVDTCSGLWVAAENTEVFSHGDLDIWLQGNPRFGQSFQIEIHPKQLSELVAKEYRKYGLDLFQRMKGHFALVLYDKAADRLILATDKLASYPLYYTKVKESGLVFSNRLRQLGARMPSAPAISAQAIFNYLYFHMIPSPETVYEGINRVEAASYLIWESGKISVKKYWMPRFREDSLLNEREIAAGLYENLEHTIASYQGDSGAGCFLSGGLDSSSVAGFMAKAKQSPVSAFSIGFPIQAYNELPYARVAAKAYGLKHFEKILHPSDVIQALPNIIQSMDQPFGNSSVIPVYYCAEYARQNGVNTLLAGDGGDELFAGNTRYQKQLVFDLYRILPEALRGALAQSVHDGKLSGNVLTRKLASYVKQSEIGLPLRLEQYNFLNRIAVDQVFNADFLQAVDRGYPEQLCQQVFNAPGQATDINKMLYLDWKHTLTDNDLVKVRSMCDLAGVAVRFPMLDDGLVDFSCDIPSHFKVNLTKLRRIYKRAVKGFLPNEIINKKKHGFGLPFGLWTQENTELKAFAYTALDKLKGYEIFSESFIELAKQQHQSDHASYYGELIWILMVLGEWLSCNETGARNAG